ncbi:MAG: thioredoxin 1 [Microgenomates group bacterium Gr01-1014_80]|nr:MAG: thioredoxin 1 [Microgenomates group bacterium Gr01-1014_80]
MLLFYSMAQIQLLDLWASWCGPCRMMEPILEEIEKEYKDKVEILKINVDENPQKASELGVMSIPTYVVLKDGKEVNRRIGFTPKAEMVKLLSV